MKSLDQIAKDLGVHKNTVMKLIRSGQLEATTIKGNNPANKLFVTKDELERYETAKELQTSNLLTKTEFAKRCGVVPKTVESWVCKGRLHKACMIGRRAYYSTGDVKEFV